MIDGITSAALGAPDFTLARIQHQAYIEALEDCELKVIVLDASPENPDSMFVEDVALLTGQCAVLTRPGAASRRGEVDLVRRAVEAEYSTVYEIAAPGCVEAGDIMMVGDHYYIGLSGRTNTDGAEQVLAILQANGMSGSVVRMDEFLHLKTGLSYLEDNNLLVTGEFVERDEFRDFNRIVVDQHEQYAANSVWINGTVLTPAGFPETSTAIKAAGYEVIELEMSEFQKLDGGLSCLSLRF